jgi:hypothetical protein
MMGQVFFLVLVLLFSRSPFRKEEFFFFFFKT